jgi:hypothetical protein
MEKNEGRLIIRYPILVEMLMEEEEVEEEEETAGGGGDDIEENVTIKT